LISNSLCTELNVHAAFVNPVDPADAERLILSMLRFEKNRSKIVISID
jgi:hypothetical protein